jgi:hypothetical protein
MLKLKTRERWIVSAPYVIHAHQNHCKTKPDEVYVEDYDGGAICDVEEIVRLLNSDSQVGIVMKTISIESRVGPDGRRVWHAHRRTCAICGEGS